MTPTLADLLEPRPPQCVHDLASGDNRKAGASRSDLDRGDDRRFSRVRQGSVLEVKLQRLAQIRECLLYALALTSDLYFEASGHVPGTLVGDRRCEFHRTKLRDSPSSASCPFQTPHARLSALLSGNIPQLNVILGALAGGL